MFSSYSIKHTLKSSGDILDSKVMRLETLICRHSKPILNDMLFIAFVKLGQESLREIPVNGKTKNHYNRKIALNTVLIH